MVINYMVKSISFGKGVAFQCEECGFKYLDEETAGRCEDFCKTHKSCSIQITRNALK
jgi:hypothetical protein